jgi:hypothetical protein
VTSDLRKSEEFRDAARFRAIVENRKTPSNEAILAKRARGSAATLRIAGRFLNELKSVRKARHDETWNYYRDLGNRVLPPGGGTNY